jgi:hypothetical protein
MPALAQTAETSLNKPLPMIEPFALAEPIDIFGRPIAERLGRRLGQPMITDSRPNNDI